MLTRATCIKNEKGPIFTICNTASVCWKATGSTGVIKNIVIEKIPNLLTCVVDKMMQELQQPEVPHHQAQPSLSWLHKCLMRRVYSSPGSQMQAEEIGVQILLRE